MSCWRLWMEQPRSMPFPISRRAQHPHLILSRTKRNECSKTKCFWSYMYLSWPNRVNRIVINLIIYVNLSYGVAIVVTFTVLFKADHAHREKRKNSRDSRRHWMSRKIMWKRYSIIWVYHGARQDKTKFCGVAPSPQATSTLKKQLCSICLCMSLEKHFDWQT
jgi:hypothetical protein